MDPKTAGMCFRDSFCCAILMHLEMLFYFQRMVLACDYCTSLYFFPKAVHGHVTTFPF